MMNNADWQEMGRYFRSAGLHPSDLVRRWSSIEAFCNSRRQKGKTVREIAADLLGPNNTLDLPVA